jgi:hypothetical protein
LSVRPNLSPSPGPNKVLNLFPVLPVEFNRYERFK